MDVLNVAEESRETPTHNLTVQGVHAYFVMAGSRAVLVHNQEFDLGDGYTGRVDSFTTSGVSSFEIHVYDPSGVEVGVHGTRDWIPKHGHSGSAPWLPKTAQTQLKGVVIDEHRARGYLPPKGHTNIKGDRWKALVHDLCP